MLPDTGIDDVKNQRNADYAKHINDPVLSSLKMEGIRLLFYKNFGNILQCYGGLLLIGTNRSPAREYISRQIVVNLELPCHRCRWEIIQ
jgi:hypothetical protein